MTTDPPTPDAAEEWRPVPGYPCFMASSLGRIHVTPGRGGRPHATVGHLGANGYMSISVPGTKPQKYARVHRLVTMAFHGLPPNGTMVAHINGCCTDNRPSNLMWATAQQNHDHSRLHGTLPLGEHRWNAKLTAADALAIVADARSGVNQLTLAKKYRVARTTIQQVLTGKSWFTVTNIKRTP